MLTTSSHHVLVLSTLDSALTLEKITEHHKDIRVVNCDDFLQNSTSSRQSFVSVVVCDKEFEVVLTRAYQQKDKVVIVTCESLYTVLEVTLPLEKEFEDENQKEKSSWRNFFGKNVPPAPIFPVIVSSDQTSWSDLTLEHQDQILSHVQNLLGLNDIQAISQMMENVEGSMLLELIHGRIPNLSIIPADPSFYIQRKLANQHNISTTTIKEAFSQDKVSEQEFFDGLLENENKPVCICGESGTGKTSLLANLGRKLYQHFPSRHIIFLRLNELVMDVKIRMETEGDKPHTNLSQVLEHVLLHITCPNKFGQALLKTALVSEESAVKVELMLDGFDEICLADQELALMCATKIKSAYHTVRLWITTHPSLVDKLEKELDMINLTIRPFTSADHLNFFRSSGISETDKVMKAIESCTVGNEMNGTPLHCKLLTEYFDEQPDNNVADGGAYNLFRLYKHFVEEKINKFMKLHSKFDDSPGKSQLVASLKYLSISLIFPEHYKSFRAALCPKEIPLQALIGMGFLEEGSRLEPPRFVHHSFAQYFVAILFQDLVNGRYSSVPKSVAAPLLLQLLGTDKVSTPNEEATTSKVGPVCDIQRERICYFFYANCQSS